MEIHELSISYLDIKNKRDEKRRVIDYELKRKLSTLKNNAFDVESRLRVTVAENEIRNEEELFQQYDAELKETEEELKPLLLELGASRKDPLSAHVEGNIYIDTYIDEANNIISNSYHRVQ